MMSAESCIEMPVPESAAPVRMVAARPVRPTSSLLPITTLVLWTGCLTIGGLGFALAYTRPQPLKPAAIATQAELLHVELTNEPLPPVEPQPSSAMTPPPLEPLPAPANVPPMMAVAPVTAEVAFALPVEGPVRIVEAAQAAYTRPTQQAVAAAPAPVQSLTYGVGEGRQPAPIYPREAVRAGQEGKVAVRFSVGENGRVLAAEAADPSPWPLLNQEALRTIRQRWRFDSGPVRVYEVTIRFELQKARGES
jgi:TonB family protein